MRRSEAINSIRQGGPRASFNSYHGGGTVPSIFGITIGDDKSLSMKLQKKKKELSQIKYSLNHLLLYKSFCPLYLYHYLTDLKGNTPISSMTKSLFGTVLVIDLSGFTKLSAELCDQGAAGLDELRQLINLYIGNFVDIITASGGDGMVFLDLNPFSLMISLFPLFSLSM